MKKILIAGASGFVGKALSKLFLSNRYHVTGIGTSVKHPFADTFQHFEWISADTTIEGQWQKQVPTFDFIINLTGRNIFRFWTKKYKKAIYDSRILTTRNIVNAIAEGGNTRKLLTTSAVGIYGDRKDDVLTESASRGNGFLADLCVDWEKEALMAEKKGIKVAVMRFGVVLGHGGALSMMAPAFKLFVGGRLGNGMHWFPWIHITDLGNAAALIIKDEDMDGIFNFAAPEPVRQKKFANSLGKALNRPALLPAPSFIVKTVMGELGHSLLQSQKAIPEKLETSGHRFMFPDIDSALKDIFKE